MGSKSRWLHWITIAAAGAFIGVGLALAPTFFETGPDNPPVTGSCGPPGSPGLLAEAVNEVFAPRIWDSWVVWTEYRDAGADDWDTDVFAYDMETGQELVLGDGPDVQQQVHVADGVAAWSVRDSETLAWYVEAQGLATAERWRLDLPLSGVKYVRGMWKDHLIVEVQSSDDNASGLWHYVLHEGLKERILPPPIGTTEIWGNLVAYTPLNESRDENQTIRTINLTTGEEVVHVSSAEGVDVPDIHEDWVVYQKSSGGEERTWDIYAYNLSSGVEIAVATDDGGRSPQTGPRVAGDWVVYMGGSFIRQPIGYAYNVHTQETIEVAGEGDWGYEYDVWENLVVFTPPETVTQPGGIYAVCI